MGSEKSVCFSRCSSGQCPEPASRFNHCVKGSIKGVSYRHSKGAAVCRILHDQCRVHLGTAGKVEDMEIRDGEEGPAGEHGKDRDYGDWH